MVMDLSSGALKGDHLGPFSFHEVGDSRSNQCSIGVEGIGDGFASEVIEYFRKVGPEHGLAARECPPPAAHGSGLVHDPEDLIKGQLVLLFS